MDGIFLGHNLLLSQASFSLTEFWLSQSLSHKLFSFFTMEFRLSRSLSLSFFFHDGISAITEPFSFFFFTMEFRLSRSPSLSFFFHDGISAITELFSRILSFFTMEFRDTKYETCNLGKTLFIYISERVFTCDPPR
jgi:hypothetical protein